MMELKPCPFCGGKARIFATTTGTYPNHGKHYCYCEKCLASGQSFSDFENDGSSIFKAIEAWNRRASDGHKHSRNHYFRLNNPVKSSAVDFEVKGESDDQQNRDEST